MRDTLNRVFVILFLIVCMGLCSYMLIWPDATEDFTGGLERTEDVLDNLMVDLFPAELRLVPRIGLGLLFALALDIILVIIFILEVRRPKAKAIKVEKAGGGEVEVSIHSIADRLKHDLGQVSGVLRVKPSVSAKRGGVVVKLDVETVAGVNVPEKADQILEKTRQVIEDQMGLTMARVPKVNLRAMPHPRPSRGAAKRPAPREPVVPASRAPSDPHDVAVEEREPDLPVLDEAPEVGEAGAGSFPLVTGDPHDQEE